MTTNPDSIFDSVKKVLGFDSEFTAFDVDITLFINSAFGTLQQLGVGGDDGFVIIDNSTLWSQYITQLGYLGMVKNFIFMTVKMAFDPPQTSFGIDAYKSQIAELAWRINVAVEALNPPSDPSIIVPEGYTLRTYDTPVVVTLPSAPSVTPDAEQGNVFYLTLTENCTIYPPVNGREGQHITLALTPGEFFASWPAGWDFGDSGIPNLTAGKTVILSAFYRLSQGLWQGGFTTGFTDNS